MRKEKRKAKLANVEAMASEAMRLDTAEMIDLWGDKDGHVEETLRKRAEEFDMKLATLTHVDSDDEEGMMATECDPNMEANRLLQAVVNKVRFGMRGEVDAIPRPSTHHTHQPTIERDRRSCQGRRRLPRQIGAGI